MTLGFIHGSWEGGGNFPPKLHSFPPKYLTLIKLSTRTSHQCTRGCIKQSGCFKLFPEKKQKQKQSPPKLDVLHIICLLACHTSPPLPILSLDETLESEPMTLSILNSVQKSSKHKRFLFCQLNYWFVLECCIQSCITDSGSSSL